MNLKISGYLIKDYPGNVAPVTPDISDSYDLKNYETKMFKFEKYSSSARIIPYDIKYNLDGSSFLTFGYRFQFYK